MLIERQAVRAILLTPQREILLLRIHPPGASEHFWITPGGGIEPGETIEEGLRRELGEELGLTEFEIGPLVWRRQHTFDWAEERISQYERYYIVNTKRFEPKMRDAVEAKTLDRFKWWPADELAKSNERLTPLSLAEIVRHYLTNGAPQKALDTETLVD
ncbi:MAG: NUDIX domain-containing protein [Anaerolineae bacterium]|nr:NUDIX domain-containing protein [Anaerolineae bacterium]